jgi:hypothetical protein
MAINLKSKYADRLTKALDYASVISGKTSTEYKMDGSEEIQLLSLVTQSLNNYNRAATANRYGTPAEMQDVIQRIKLDKDRSFSIPVDKGNFIEGNFLKTAGAVIEDEMNEVVAPEIEADFFKKVASNAGGVYANATAISASNIMARLLAVEAAFRNGRIPKADRFVAMKTTALQLIKQALTNCDGITDKLMMQGIVGRIGTLMILEVADSDLPSGVNFVAWQKRCAVFHKTIEDTKVHQDPPGISGILVEGRFRWGGGVVGKYAAGTYVDALNTSRQGNPTLNANGSVTSLNSAQYVLCTVDGSDPRYSATAVKLTSTGSVTHTSGDVLKAVGYYDGKIASEVTSVTTTS